MFISDKVVHQGKPQKKLSRRLKYNDCDKKNCTFLFRNNRPPTLVQFKKNCLVKVVVERIRVMVFAAVSRAATTGWIKLLYGCCA